MRPLLVAGYRFSLGVIMANEEWDRRASLSWMRRDTFDWRRLDTIIADTSIIRISVDARRR